MTFPTVYKSLSKNEFRLEDYKIVPIRFEDRSSIMEWRNEQIYHLRQTRPLTIEDQNQYFINTVALLFEQTQPTQLLFSYLKNEICIGYGGLVHINHTDKNAEISFIMNTTCESLEFHKNWGIFLELLQQVAFEELKLHKIYTYAFDLRPHLYEAIEAKGFLKEAVLKDHCYFDGIFKSVVIHSKINAYLSIRPIQLSDEAITFKWASDPLTRNNSYQSAEISSEVHHQWFAKKLLDEMASYWILEVNQQAAGLIRFDKDKTSTVIGIMMGKEFRGKGLSSTFLRLACEAYFTTHDDTEVIAYIKKENLASIKSFEKAGFKTFKEEKIHGTDSLVLKYNHHGT